MSSGAAAHPELFATADSEPFAARKATSSTNRLVEGVPGHVVRDLAHKLPECNNQHGWPRHSAVRRDWVADRALPRLSWIRQSCGISPDG
jgi:hypothetical protein